MANLAGLSVVPGHAESGDAAYKLSCAAVSVEALIHHAWEESRGRPSGLPPLLGDFGRPGYAACSRAGRGSKTSILNSLK